MSPRVTGRWRSVPDPGGLEDSEQARLMVSDARWSRRADITGGLLFASDQPAPIPAGAPIYLELQTLRHAGSTEVCCGTNFAFVPEAGRTYAVAPNASGGRRTDRQRLLA